MLNLMRTRSGGLGRGRSVGSIDHPAHYGGDNTYEAIKVIEAWDLGFCLGNVVKYISRAGRKPGADLLDDLRKARWYLEREIQNVALERAMSVDVSDKDTVSIEYVEGG